jgi:UDP-N-acetylmuramoyl-tripeptide--D-alanyl-D-alanine ligase
MGTGTGIELGIEAAVAAMGGTLLARGSAPSIAGVSIDSRAIAPGQAFFALRGEHHDGHDHLAQAAAAGAALLVVDAPAPADLPGAASVVRVGDTRRALGALGHAWRRKVSPRVVAITGSVGKTTTKELARAVVSRLGPTHSTAGNFNNDIGLPLTLLALGRGTRHLVVELGMNAPGEIAYLAGLCVPDIGLVTCIAPVHLEGLGSLEGIAAAKGELLAALGPAGFAIVPGNEPLLAPHLSSPPDRVLRFGEGADDEVRLASATPLGARGSDVRLVLRGREEISFRLALPGRHNARNAAAAAAVGLALDVPPAEIAAALAEPPSLAHRSITLSLGGLEVFDDCYNANPVAMRAALDAVVGLAGGREVVAVLGEMRELGPGSEGYHLDLGRYTAGLGLAALITVGPAAATVARGALEAGLDPARVVAAADVEEATRALLERARPGAWVLVKASRGAHLEGIIERLKRGEST